MEQTQNSTLIVCAGLLMLLIAMFSTLKRRWNALKPNIEAGSPDSLAVVRTTKYNVLDGDFTSLNVSNGDRFAECRPLFDISEQSIPTLCDFTLLFSTSGVALLVGLNDVVAIAQARPVLDLEAALSLLPAGWVRQDGLLYSLSGCSADAVQAIRRCALEGASRPVGLPACA